MEKREKNFWDMEKRSIAYADDKKEKWVENTIISELMAELRANEAECNVIAVTQEGSQTNGATTKKNLAVLAFNKKINKLDRKIVLYAKRNKNAALVVEAAFTESLIEKIDETKLFVIYANLLKIARTNLEALKAYGLTEEELNALDVEFTALGNLVDQRDLKNEEHKGATRNIKEVQNDAREILDQLDDAFEGMIDDEEFIIGWYQVRKIKGNKSSSKDDEDEDNTDDSSTETSAG